MEDFGEKVRVPHRPVSFDPVSGDDSRSFFVFKFIHSRGRGTFAVWVGGGDDDSAKKTPV